jgi:hypothetical protein
MIDLHFTMKKVPEVVDFYPSSSEPRVQSYTEEPERQDYPQKEFSMELNKTPFEIVGGRNDHHQRACSGYASR